MTISWAKDALHTVVELLRVVNAIDVDSVTCTISGKTLHVDEKCTVSRAENALDVVVEGLSLVDTVDVDKVASSVGGKTLHVQEKYRVTICGVYSIDDRSSSDDVHAVDDGLASDDICAIHIVEVHEEKFHNA